MLLRQIFAGSFDKVVAVDDISFEVGAGEIFALLRPNEIGRAHV